MYWGTYCKLISGLVDQLPRSEMMDEKVRGRLVLGLVDQLPRCRMMDEEVRGRLISGLFQVAPKMDKDLCRQVRRKLIEYTG